MADSLKEWTPKYPRLAKVAEVMRTIADSSKIGDFLLGGKADALSRVAYEQPLTTGSGMTTGLRPEATELSDFIPGPGTLAKGAKSAVVIGPIGMKNLGDRHISIAKDRLMETLMKMHPDNWKGQVEKIKEAGFTPIPRGRDFDPNRPTPHFGIEIPEGEPTSRMRYDIRDAADTKSMIGSPMMELYNAPRLLRAYPEMGSKNVLVDGGLEGAKGSFNPRTGSVVISPDKNKANALLQHEFQHAIQAMEGWPGGTNVSMASALLDRLRGGEIPEKEARKFSNLMLVDKNRPELKDAIPYTLYRREAGEQLAEAAAQSADRGGGRIDDFYTVDPKGMYDIRVLLPDWYPQ